MLQPPPFNSAITQGKVTAGVFAFKLASSGSALFLGGTDTSKYTGSIEPHAVVRSAGYWEISGASALVGSTAAVSGFNTIIDSGTTIIYGYPSAVATFYSKITGSQVYDSSEGYYSYPCDTTQTVGFSWGGKEWVISPANFNLGEVALRNWPNLYAEEM